MCGMTIFRPEKISYFTPKLQLLGFRKLGFLRFALEIVKQKCS